MLYRLGKYENQHFGKSCIPISVLRGYCDIVYAWNIEETSRFKNPAPIMFPPNPHLSNYLGLF
jgi:hypothetical protein